MNCKKCGKRLGKEEIICKRCGTDSSKIDIIGNMKAQLSNEKAKGLKETKKAKTTKAVKETKVAKTTKAVKTAKEVKPKEVKIDKISEIKQNIQDNSMSFNTNNELDVNTNVNVEPVSNVVSDPVVEPLNTRTSYESIYEQDNYNRFDGNKEEVINTRNADFDTISNMDNKESNNKNIIVIFAVVIAILMVVIMFVKYQISKYQLEQGIDNEISIEDLELRDRRENNDKKKNLLNDNSVDNSVNNTVTNTTENTVVDDNEIVSNVIDNDKINGNILNDVIDKRKNTTTTTTTDSSSKVNITTNYKTRNVVE